MSLDSASLKPDDLSVPALMREFTLQRRPAWLLIKLMGVLEHRRQVKGVGWSRPWNKTGLTIFRTHVHDIERDADFFPSAYAVLDNFLADSPAEYREFVADLLADPRRMAFTFYHNHKDESGRQFEGLTLSLGRVVNSDATKRDRLDLILEDLREEGRVDGMVDLLRIYVCPWSKYRAGRAHHQVTLTEPTTNQLISIQPMYMDCVTRYHAWKSDAARQRSHWSERYTEYFGARNFIPQHSSFT